MKKTIFTITLLLFQLSFADLKIQSDEFRGFWNSNQYSNAQDELLNDACEGQPPACYTMTTEGDAGFHHYKCCYRCDYGGWKATCQGN